MPHKHIFINLLTRRVYVRLVYKYVHVFTISLQQLFNMNKVTKSSKENLTGDWLGLDVGCLLYTTLPHGGDW